MLDRRGLLTGGAALGVGLIAGQAKATSLFPRFHACARDADGSYSVHRHGTDGWRVPLPARGHDCVLRPGPAPDLAVFARRPGWYLLIIDPDSGTVRQHLHPPPGRHLFGHGVYTADGALLLTTENAYETGAGVIGVWDATGPYRRVGEFPSGGNGPHDIALHPDGAHVIVANGGICTHPDQPRIKLNLANMAPNLAVMALATGQIVSKVIPPDGLTQASIRHLSVRADGLIALAMQWEGPADITVPLLALSDGTDYRLLAGPWPAFDHYIGSVAFAGDGRRLAATSSRGGVIGVFDLAGSTPPALISRTDISGIDAHGTGFLATDGLGIGWQVDGVNATLSSTAPLAWDNHLIAL